MGGLPSEVAAVLEADRDYDAEELLVLTQRLRRELHELDVGQVAFERQGVVPKGAAGVEALARGGLVIHCALSPALLRSVANATVAWLGRQPTRSVKLTIEGDALEVTGVASDEQSRLIEQWVARHAETDVYRDP